MEFQGKDENYLAQKTDEELISIQSSIDDCLRNSYLQLPRLDLAVAGETAAMVARELQAHIDQVFIRDLLKNHVDLQANTAPTPSSSTVTLTVSPLPNGLTRTFKVMGHENTCVAVESMRLMCTINEGPPNAIKIPLFLVAMIATRKGLPTFEGSFLMGCNPGLSANCSPLVPGDYAAEFVGTDGISIAGIVAEDKPNEPPRHLAFVIYSRP